MALGESELLLENGGEIHAPFFSALGDLTDQLMAWMRAAPDDASEDATKAYVYWKAFAWKAQQAAENPAQEDYDDAGSARFLESQLQTWPGKRDEWRAAFYDRYGGSDAAGGPRRREKAFAPVHSRR